ncbi:hypothetical protein TNCV_4017931 [Trichonephila clavipes]|nr:hypothetical protein TNCV_4017931 [Trichonephila clavipes]
MTPTTQYNMMRKFIRIRLLNFIPDRGRVSVSLELKEDATLAVMEASSQSSHGVVSKPAVSYTIDMCY